MFTKNELSMERVCGVGVSEQYRPQKHLNKFCLPISDKGVSIERTLQSIISYSVSGSDIRV